MKEVIVPADDLVCIGKEKLQEVIRCKDCKHCMIFSMFTSKWYVCCRNENGEILVEKQEEIFTDSLNKFMKWGHTIFIDIFAYNDEQAKKIALDKYAEYKYRKVNNEL